MLRTLPVTHKLIWRGHLDKVIHYVSLTQDSLNRSKLSRSPLKMRSVTFFPSMKRFHPAHAQKKYFVPRSLKVMNSRASFVLHVITEMQLDSNAQENCSPFLRYCLAIFFFPFCPALMWCQSQAPFLQVDRVESWMLSNACTFGVFR